MESRFDPSRQEARGANGAAAAEGRSSHRLALRVRSGDALDVRAFAIREAMSSLFELRLTVVAPDPQLDFDAIVGESASFAIRGHVTTAVRFWTGLCSDVQQVAVEEHGLSTYELTIVPALWLLTQRRNHRIFQQVSELEIAKKILEEWGITPRLAISDAYKPRKYRVQYAESDYAFVCRLLEDAGISFYFAQGEAETELVLTDGPERSRPREAVVAYRDNPTVAQELEHVTKLKVGQRVRPGRYTIGDRDLRLPPTLPVVASAAARDRRIEERLERFHYAPGSFHFGSDKGEPTPHADDRGKSRTDFDEGARVATRRLEAKRADAKVITFETNAADLAPGVVFRVGEHPRSELGEGNGLLVVASSWSGTHDGVWRHAAEARLAKHHFCPKLATPKPRVSGVEYATVVGPEGEEIHTDEFGRVRVHFHWDRESKMNERSSCWIPVSQSWGGAGYGGSNLPRVGQEVLVDFVGGNPDMPIIVGRVYTKQQATPYKLPDNKTQSGWKSNSTQKTGGYNEIMFEDAAGRELVRMQAEKDLDKLVKHDESVVIGHDRQKLVKNDDQLTVGRDRRKVVDNDEEVTIGNDRVKIVNNDDNLTVGNDRTKLIQMSSREVVGQNRSRTVGVNETVSIGASHQLTVGADQAVQIGGSHTTQVAADHSTSVGASQSTDVGAAQSTTVGGAHALSVALASAETIGALKALTVGGAYEVTVGGIMQTNVMAMSTESVGMNKTITVGQQFELVCGKSKLTMDAAGTITLAVDGGGSIVLDTKNVTVKAPGVVTIVAPLVDVNPS